MCAELSEVYTAKFQLMYDPVEQGKKKATKKVKGECNEACR